jgi:hypothetical protein
MDTVLTIQLYRDGLAPLRLDLAPAHQAERRINDIAFATKHHAKELFSTFLRGYINVAKSHAVVKLHAQKAAIEARKRRAVLLIDHIPAMAKEKGLATSRNATGSEDVREAFYYTDPEYVRIEEARAHLEAAEALLFGKMMAMKAAHDACKAMLSPEDRPVASNTAEAVPGPYGVDERPAMVQEEHEEAQGFGEPRHNR